MAHKKAAGSADNLRDSNPKYRGLKVAGGEAVQAGNILIRQKGDTYQGGRGVYKARDFTLHASIDGIATFSRKVMMRYDGRRYTRTLIEVLPAARSTSKTAPSKQPISKTSTPSPKKQTTAKKTSSPSSDQDDLTKIEGIGPVIQGVLYDHDITTYEILSTTKVGDLRDILAENDLAQHEPKTRKKQATLAKHGKWEELEDLQKELDGGV